MINLLPVSLLRFWLIVGSGTLVISVVCIYLSFHVRKRPLAPTIPILSVCKAVEPNMTRMVKHYGLQFDAPSKDFTFVHGTSDMPPGLLGFDLTPISSKSTLDI